MAGVKNKKRKWPGHIEREGKRVVQGREREE
jgi:hypothetical protein